MIKGLFKSYCKSLTGSKAGQAIGTKIKSLESGKSNKDQFLMNSKIGKDHSHGKRKVNTS